MTKLKLPKSGYELELLEELTGEIIIELEKNTKRSMNIEQVLESNKPGFKHKKKKDIGTTSIMKFGENLRVTMEYAHLMIVSIVDSNKKEVEVTADFVKKLGLTDYKVVKDKVEGLIEGVDAF